MTNMMTTANTNNNDQQQQKCLNRHSFSIHIEDEKANRTATILNNADINYSDNDGQPQPNVWLYSLFFRLFSPQAEIPLSNQIKK